MIITLTIGELLQTWLDNQDTYTSLDVVGLEIDRSLFKKELIGLKVDAR